MYVPNQVKAGLVGASLVALFSQAFAQSGMPPGVAAAAPSDVSVLAAVGPKKLINTFIAAGNGGASALPTGVYTVIDTSAVNCGNAAGCTYGFESMVQIKPVAGDWAICLFVDSISVSCQYQGHLGSTSGWVVGNARGVRLGVAQGAHTVQTKVYVEGTGAVLAAYQTDYRVYKP